MGPGQLLLQHRGRSSQPAPSAFLFSVSFLSPSSCTYSRRPALQAISRPRIQQCHSPSDFCGSPNRHVTPQNRLEQISKYTLCLIITVNVWEIIYSVSFWSFWRQWNDFLKFYTAHTRTPRFLEIKLRFSYYDSFYIIGKKKQHCSQSWRHWAISGIDANQSHLNQSFYPPFVQAFCFVLNNIYFLSSPIQKSLHENVSLDFSLSCWYVHVSFGQKVKLEGSN